MLVGQLYLSVVFNLLKGKLMPSSYIENQFTNVRNDGIPNMQIVSDNGRTNWLNLTQEQLARIEDILKEELCSTLPA